MRLAAHGRALLCPQNENDNRDYFQSGANDESAQEQFNSALINPATLCTLLTHPLDADRTAGLHFRCVTEG